MRTCSVVLTFESVDEILWCDHSNETSSAVLLHGTICFSILYKLKYRIFFNFDVWHTWEFKINPFTPREFKEKCQFEAINAIF